jgi:hypothetical protein
MFLYLHHQTLLILTDINQLLLKNTTYFNCINIVYRILMVVQILLLQPMFQHV